MAVPECEDFLRALHPRLVGGLTLHCGDAAVAQETLARVQAGSDGRSDDVTLGPSASTTATTASTSTTGASPWPDCTEADFEIVPNPAGEQPAFTLNLVEGAPECVLTTLMTFTFLDPVDLPNPLALRSGILWNQQDQGPLEFEPIEVTLNLQPPAALIDCGLEAGHGYRVRSENTIEGFGPQPTVTAEEICG